MYLNICSHIIVSHSTVQIRLKTLTARIIRRFPSVDGHLLVLVTIRLSNGHLQKGLYGSCRFERLRKKRCHNCTYKYLYALFE